MNKDKMEEWSLKKDGEGGEFDFIDQGGCSWRSPSSWLFTGILGGCGCGSSEEFGDEAVKLLANFALPHDKRDLSVYDDRFLELLAHWFDSKGVIEHGSSIGGSWLTEKGKKIHEAILALTPPPNNS